MIANKNEAKATTKHISCDYKCKFSSATCNSNQKWISKTCRYECNSYLKSKNIIGILTHVFVGISSI